jgi:hypothetical protein
MPKVERLIIAGSLHSPKRHNAFAAFVDLWLWVLVLILSLAALAYWGT